MRILASMVLASLLATGVHASGSPASDMLLAPQPTTCISAAFSSTGSQYWRNIVLRLTNNCGRTVDFQNTTITFENTIQINTSFWGDFAPLSYPDNVLKIVSPPLGSNYLASMFLHFPTYPGAVSQLPAGRTIALKYGATAEGHVEGTAKIYLGTPINSANLELKNASARPANINQDPMVHVTMNGQRVTDVQVSWLTSKIVPNLSPGTYVVSADSVTDGTTTYQASVNPSTVNVVENQTALSTITYSAVTSSARVAIRVQALPSELSGYTGSPTATVTRTSNGSSTSVPLSWGATRTVSSLVNGSVYTFSTPVINYNSYQCTPTFTPSSLTASTSTTPTTNLTYGCALVGQNNVTLNVTGGPSTLSSLQITLTPNNNTAPVVRTVNLTNGSGSSSVQLPSAVTYQVSASAVSGYTASFNPQPLVSAPNAVETITLQQQSGGDTPVGRNGQLRVCGTKLCNQAGTPIQLRGMSSHGIQWYGWQGSNTEKACLTTASLDTLANSWKASVMRISMYVQEGGYETDPVGFTNQVNTLINEATKRGIYAIVDFHMLEPGDPNYNLARAKKFFTDVANANKGKNNLLYEICNEPSGVNWATIKSYADQLIPVIRAIDPNSPILVGTVAWSSLGVSDGRTHSDITNNPVNFPNIMYTFHFYAASHRDEYLNELDRASNVLPIFVTEFGTQTYTGDGGNDFAMSERYMTLMANKQISWTNWNYSDDNRSGAVWKSGTCSNGPWSDTNLKPAGVWMKAKIQ